MIDRHPFRGSGAFSACASTGSRTHPWLYSATPSGVEELPFPDLIHGFADSPVALFRHPFGGFIHASGSTSMPYTTSRATSAFSPRIIAAANSTAS